MEKNYIKQMVKESLNAILVKEAEVDQSNQKIKSEYSEIQSGLEGIGAPSQADIMQIAGMGKVGDKTSESLFGKKLHRAKNDEGGVYQFNDEERASIIKALNRAKK